VHVSIDLNTDSDSDPDADDAVRADDALASRRAAERAAELTAENARLRGLLDESDAKAARAEARLRDALDPSRVAYRAAADGALDLDLVTRDAAASLQREIQSQDAILRGYQRENEAATATLADAKRLAADTEAKLRAHLARDADEIARLRIRLEAAEREARTRSDSEPEPDSETTPAEDAETDATTNAKKKSSAMAEALARHLDAEKRAASREAELRDALESTRAKLREAETGVGVDALRDALEEERARREAETSELAALRARVEWFTENQRLATDADETTRRHAATVESLERRLARADRELAKLKGFGFGKKTTKSTREGSHASHASAAAVGDAGASSRRESALSRRDRYAGGTLAKSRPKSGNAANVANAASTSASVSTSAHAGAKVPPADPRDQSSAGVAALLGGGSSSSPSSFPSDVHVDGSAAFDAGLARNPDSVAALVRAVRPTEDHAGKIAELEARCRRLRDELDAADAERERALRALQVEHLRLKSGMEKRVAAAEAAEATARKRAAAAARLEREVRELRGALERRKAEANAERRRADAAERRLRERDGDAGAGPAGIASVRERTLVDDGSDADGDASGDENADENGNDGAGARGRTNSTATPPEGHPAITPFDPSPFRSKSRATRSNERIGDGATDRPTRSPTKRAAKAETDEKDSNRGEIASRSPANFDAPVAGEDATAKPVATEAAVEVSTRAKAPRASISASLRASLPLEASASAAAKRSAPPASAVPEPSYPEPIAARLRRLEDRAAARETHWRSVLNEVQKAHAADAAGLRRQCARAVEAKNVQIRHFREKLNRLIAAMHERSLRESTRRSDDAAATAAAAAQLAAR
jgi:colicin import membrane protein